MAKFKEKVINYRAKVSYDRKFTIKTIMLNFNDLPPDNKTFAYFGGLVSYLLSLRLLDYNFFTFEVVIKSFYTLGMTAAGVLIGAIMKDVYKEYKISAINFIKIKVFKIKKHGKDNKTDKAA